MLHEIMILLCKYMIPITSFLFYVIILSKQDVFKCLTNFIEHGHKIINTLKIYLILGLLTID